MLWLVRCSEKTIIMKLFLRTDNYFDLAYDCFIFHFTGILFVSNFVAKMVLSLRLVHSISLFDLLRGIKCDTIVLNGRLLLLG